MNTDKTTDFLSCSYRRSSEFIGGFSLCFSLNHQPKDEI